MLATGVGIVLLVVFQIGGNVLALAFTSDKEVIKKRKTGRISVCFPYLAFNCAATI